jgi:hypothetical protein
MFDLAHDGFCLIILVCELFHLVLEEEDLFAELDVLFLEGSGVAEHQHIILGCAEDALLGREGVRRFVLVLGKVLPEEAALAEIFLRMVEETR